MRKDACVTNVKIMLLKGLRHHAVDLTHDTGAKYLAAQAMRVNPTLFNQIGGNQHDRMTADLLLRVCIDCQLPVTIQLDGKGFADVVFPSLPEDQFGP